MRRHLMISKRFAPLFWTQFLSAFNDNFLRYSLVFLILVQLQGDEAASLITLASAIFMLPFLILSALGGELADKYDKGWLAERLKLFEIGAAFVAVAGIILASVPVSMLALFFFGVISALFGPIKYGILPDLMGRRELPGANAWVEGATFIAILAGTIAAGFVADDGLDPRVFAPVMLILALVCWLISRHIPKTGFSNPDLRVSVNIVGSTIRLVRELREDKRLWTTALFISWFWLMGAVLTALVPSFVDQVMGGSPLVVTIYSVVFAVSVAIGSAIAAWLCAGRVVLLPAPFGAALLAFFCMQLAWNLSQISEPLVADSVLDFFTHTAAIRVAIDLGGLAISGALLVVPSFTALQSWARRDHRARVVAGANILNAGFIVFSGVAVAAFQAVGLSASHVFTTLAVANIVVAWLMVRYMPTNPLWDLVNILFRTFSRLEVEGRENLEKAGKSPILAFNHVSFLDGPLAMAITEEEPIFAIDAKTAKTWWMHPFMRFFKYLVLEPSQPVATEAVVDALQSGNSLVIFPEGRVSATGGLMKVYDVAAMAAEMTGSKVVPIRIEGLERSYSTAIEPGNVRRQFFPKVKVTILEPVKLQVPPSFKGRRRRMAAGASLQRVMSELVLRTTDVDMTVLENVIKVAHGVGMRRVTLEDPFAGQMSYGRLLTAARVLGTHFQRDFAAEERVGVLLPNATGTAAVILGLMSAGKIPAMLNFSTGVANMISSCKTAQLKSVLTSRTFIEQGKLEDMIAKLSEHVEIVWVDDLRGKTGTKDKLSGLLHRSKPLVVRKADDPAVILFTSGSEGLPKGVILTHRNLLANIAQAAAAIDFNMGDVAFNVLPMFHCFGLTVGTILPLIHAIPVYLYPSPLHYRIIPELVYGTNATLFFGTDTFLNGYARTAHPFDFRSLRYCISGAEAVKAPTRELFMQRFGVRLLEGYGVTETAPVIAVNTPIFNKVGTVGKALPGIQTKLSPVPGLKEGGRLLIKGDNVMVGYLSADKPGEVIPPPDGWHDTGDIVTIDEEGYIKIIGRAKRFADIAGEKVSLAAVEVLAFDLWPDYLSAAARLPDAKKGEKIILVTNKPDADLFEFSRHAKANGAADILVPAELIIDEVPVLATGKVDLASVQKRVEEIKGVKCH
nr:acyl-[ACP]--phospholipid O-acyltransferase [uncultured Cohaesibacter sp.]